MYIESELRDAYLGQQRCVVNIESLTFNQRTLHLLVWLNLGNQPENAKLFSIYAKWWFHSHLLTLDGNYDEILHKL